MDPSRSAARNARARLQHIAAFSWLIIAWIEAKPTLACPDCALGREAWFWFFHDRFSLHLLAAGLPFLFVGGVSAILAARDRSSADGRPETRR
jgi:hypothetical protein